jgi:putative glutamine amidotransferase
MSRPLIAVSAAIEELATAFGPQDCTKLTAAYTEAVYRAGGQPAILPVTSPPPVDLMERMDGLVLTGGGDIDPSVYREQPRPEVYGVRPDRDRFEAALYRQAIGLRIPILAICRGMQLVNVLRGGTLRQQIDDDPRHWQEKPAHLPNHPIILTPGTSLHLDLGPSIEAEVNSYHHQCIREIGTDLRVTAIAIGVIEGVEAPDADLVAVQWHPEQMAATDPRQQQLFDSFVRRAAIADRAVTRQEIKI